MAEVHGGSAAAEGIARGAANEAPVQARLEPLLGPPSSAQPALAEARRIERRRRRAQRLELLARVVLPALVIGMLLLLWDAAASIEHGLPTPALVLQTLAHHWARLAPALGFTLEITLLALAAALAAGVLLAMAFALSRWVEIGLGPIAVALQVTPLVAIAPLVLVYAPNTLAAVLLCAFIAAFVPLLAHAVSGLKSVDSNLHDLHTLYGSTPWQRLRLLWVPSALPRFLGGLKIAGVSSLMGTVVGEFVAAAAGRPIGAGTGTGTGGGLAVYILQSLLRGEMPMLFAALLLVTLLGLGIYIVFALLAHLALGRRHEGEA